MLDVICKNFESYVKDAKNIFDIMAAAYKIMMPFEVSFTLEQDPVVRDIVFRFCEQSNRMLAFSDIKEDLIQWIYSQKQVVLNKIKKKMFFLIRLIDGRCVKERESFLPDSYSRYGALNKLFQNEISIVPRYQSVVVKELASAIKEEDGKGFYRRNYDSTADVSGYLQNFIIYPVAKIKPCITVPNYYEEIRKEFEQKNYKLKVGIFPLSNRNIRCIFRIKEEINMEEKNGLFRIEAPFEEEENAISERCKEALRECKDDGVDIAIFPEMLFTKKNQEDVISFIKSEPENGKRFPWFIWMGTVWENRENRCMVIDQYGKVIFEQKKHVSYEYRKVCESEAVEDGISKRKSNVRVKIREDLSHENDRKMQLLDLPGMFRIATAICRDISDDALKPALKRLYSDLIMIPAFSNSDRLTRRHIEALAMEQVMVFVCNACSALCKEEKKSFQVTDQMLGKDHMFCYLCMPAKAPEDNAADYHPVKYSSACMYCDMYCKGHIREISFSECVRKNGIVSAKVT